MTDSKKSQLAQVEESILELWNTEQTFQKSLELRRGAPNFSFYDGPPFANGLPHFGAALVTSIKDSLGRYKTMRGFYVERRNGWDCHGLPVEFAIEKQFGISGKKQILELGIDKFNDACRASVFMYKGEWEQFINRIGRWTDTKNAYATIDTEYTESVWWVLKQVHNKGLLYKGHKSMPYCPRCETPLSNFEVNEGYKDDVPDPSLYVKFKLEDEDAYLLAWTTTPWSLPGNAAIAVNPSEKYVYVRHTTDEGHDEVVILAKKRLNVLDARDFAVIKEVNGNDLVGQKYQPLFEAENRAGMSEFTDLYSVLSAPFVSVDDGTGVLHVAPAFGEDDLSLTETHKLPVLTTVDASGHLLAVSGLPEVGGKFFKSADKIIIEFLSRQNLVFAAETFTHTYPFCYRCDTPLLYYAVGTWFIRVSEIKDQLLKTADSIKWMPGHIKDGRFGKWLEGARDWAISRNRYWGAPMPIWVNTDDENDYIVIESIAELQDLAGNNAKLDDLHRPFIDAVEFEKDGKTYHRVEEVLDCWFESGSMPMAQQHYPFENDEKFAHSFPADYVGEGLDQTRLWFYVLHVMSTIVFDKPAYKNVLVNGMIMAADGQKLSKRLKNYPPVDDVFNNEGADSLRLYLLSNYQAVAGDYMRFNRDAMKDINRNVLGTLLNTHRFFKMYTDIDTWKPPKTFTLPKSTNVLDKWLLARLAETVHLVTEAADNYKLAYAIQPIFDFIDDMSNWYVRRSRRRFWKSENDNDKNQAYETLWYALIKTCQLLAPWAPFISDYLWRELIKDADLPASVHLSDWPEDREYDGEVLENMKQTRLIVEQGLALRMFSGNGETQVKVRQPLSSLSYTGKSLGSDLEFIIAEEVNIKQIQHIKTDDSENLQVTVDKKLTPELKREGLVRDLVRNVQNARKQAGLNVEDRIQLYISTESVEIQKAITEHKAVIMAETLATQFSLPSDGFVLTVNVEGQEISIQLKKSV